MSNIIPFRGKHHTYRLADNITAEMEQGMLEAKEVFQRKLEAKHRAEELLEGKDLLSQTLFGPILADGFMRMDDNDRS